MEWKRKQKRHRDKILLPLCTNPAIIDIPLLVRRWSNVMTEIVKHVSDADLLKLRQVSVLVKKHCDREIRTRKRFWPSLNEMDKFFNNKVHMNNYRIYRDAQYYYPPSHPHSQHYPVHPYYRHYPQYRKYQKATQIIPCSYYEYGATLHDPYCTCGLGMSAWGEDFDQNLLLDTEIDLLLNPKALL